jgi:hypothetical protein
MILWQRPERHRRCSEHYRGLFHKRYGCAVVMMRSLDEEFFLAMNLSCFAEYQHKMRYRLLLPMW